jgi:hypothetical protein
MRTNKLNKVFFFGCLSALVGCSGYSITGGPGKTVAPSLMSTKVSNSDLLGVNVLAVLPLQYEDRATALSDRGPMLYANLVSESQAELLLHVVPANDVLKALNADRGVTAGAVPMSKLSDSVRRLGADSALLTRVHRYTERVGSGVSADVPAGVDFSMSLVRVADNHELWRANYYFQDQALSENLFRIGQTLKESGQGGRWHTAAELLQAGFQKALSELAERRTEAFAGRE